MEAFIYYVLKSSLLLLLFYGCYQVLLRKETLFRFNRLFLLVGLVLSAVLPLVYITSIIVVPLAQFQQITPTETSIIDKAIPAQLTMYVLCLLIYLIGAVFSCIRLTKQALNLKSIIVSGQSIKSNHHVLIKTKEAIQPFSFFNYIVYNPTRHTEKELQGILAHEEVHATQLHSIDILLVQIFIALQWFNPVIWLYGIAIKQNLEFLADAENHQIKIDKKAYQYSLLRHAVGNHKLSIVNPFFNSFIKKRIVMINQQQSRKSMALKSIIILPLLAFFLVSFNIKKVYRFTNHKQVKFSNDTIEKSIDKYTTDEQLLAIKADLAKEKFDFSYTTVRNDNGEIKDISIQISGGTKKTGETRSRFNSTSDNDTIDPIFIHINSAMNSISIGTAEVIANTGQVGSVNGAKLEHTDNTSNEMSINLENSEESNPTVTTKKIKSSTNKKISISTSSSSNYDVKISEEEGKGFMFIDTDGKEEPLFYVDGKLSDSKTIKGIDPSKIDAINVLKGEAAIEKYGQKAIYGVIEITLKK